MGPFSYLTCIMAFFIPFTCIHSLCQFYSNSSPVLFTKNNKLRNERKDNFSVCTAYSCFSLSRYIKGGRKSYTYTIAFCTGCTSSFYVLFVIAFLSFFLLPLFSFSSTPILRRKKMFAPENGVGGGGGMRGDWLNPPPPSDYGHGTNVSYSLR